jgi:hypothetical protein
VRTLIATFAAVIMAGSASAQGEPDMRGTWVGTTDSQRPAGPGRTLQAFRTRPAAPHAFFHPPRKKRLGGNATG